MPEIEIPLETQPARYPPLNCAPTSLAKFEWFMFDALWHMAGNLFFRLFSHIIDATRIGYQKHEKNSMTLQYCAFWKAKCSNLDRST